MKVVRAGGAGDALYVLPDVGRTPLAGPFASGTGARLWIVEQVEAGLRGDRLETWRAVADRLPSPTDCGLELALLSLIARGVPLAHLSKYIPPRGAVDYKLPAAGEREPGEEPSHAE